MMNTKQSSYPSYPAASVAAATTTTTNPTSNPYISTTPYPKDPKSNVSGGNVPDPGNKWGKMVEQTTTGIWQHLRTGPSILDTTWGRLSHGTKVLKEGGYEKVFKQTFQTSPDEKLKDSFACFLSTTAGSLPGHLFVSTKRIGFASNQPISHEQTPGEITWSIYKVMIPLNRVMAINASRNPKNFGEKYIQITTNDNHEFWLLGFLNHDKAMKVLEEAKAQPFQHGPLGHNMLEKSHNLLEKSSLKLTSRTHKQ